MWAAGGVVFGSVMLENVCSLTTKCVLLLRHVFSYYSMCSLTVEWGEDEDAGYWVS